MAWATRHSYILAILLTPTRQPAMWQVIQERLIVLRKRIRGTKHQGFQKVFNRSGGQAYVHALMNQNNPLTIGVLD